MRKATSLGHKAVRNPQGTAAGDGSLGANLAGTISRFYQLLIQKDLRYGAGRGSDYRYLLILNKLLKILDAQNCQNAGNAVLEYATSTRDFRRKRDHARSFFDLQKTANRLTER